MDLVDVAFECGVAGVRPLAFRELGVQLAPKSAIGSWFKG
jgi:hypothetical protein